jgi:HSP20 family protein
MNKNIENKNTASNGIENRGIESPANGLRLSPRCDIWETPEAVHLAAEMPGVDEKDIDVSIERNVLSIAGRVGAESAQNDAEQGWRHVLGGLSRGTFERSFQLSTEVDTTDIRANAVNGVLTLTLPKRAPKRVTVNVT